MDKNIHRNLKLYTSFKNANTDIQEAKTAGQLASVLETSFSF
jgi:hypothetical protein